MPSNEDNFRERHSLAASADLSNLIPLIDAVGDVHKHTSNWLGEVDNPDPREMFVIRCYLNLIGRIEEQTSGMIVCLATKAWTSAEALARVVLESSVNLMHMAAHGGEQPILGFIDAWLTDHEKRLAQWRKLADADVPGEVDRIDQRIEFARSSRKKVNYMESKLGLRKSEKPQAAWPSSVIDRFKSVDMEFDYRSTYHRLSSATHMLAEDTFNWLALIYTDAPDHLREAAAAEARAYSLMVCQFSLLTTMKCMMACCLATKAPSVQIIKKHHDALVIEIMKTGPLAGVPQSKTQ